MNQRWAVLFTMLLGAASLASPYQDVIAVASEETLVPILVTDGRGKPITGLQASDFEIRDNGVLQEVVSAEPQEQMPVSATLVFDMSRSVNGTKLDHLKDAANGFLSNLKKEDSAALITFNNTVILGSPLTHDLGPVKLALNQARSFGDSSLIDASYAGLLLAETGSAETGSEVPLVVIFSDGLDTRSWLTEEAVLETAKRNDAVVYGVSTGRLPEKSFLSDLAEITAGSLFPVGSIDKLPTVFLRILDEFRQRYMLAYRPRGVSDSGWHKLEVRVKHRSVKIRARTGYISPGNMTNERNTE